MEKEHYIGLIIVVGIIAIILFGGSKGASKNGLLSTGNKTPVQKQKPIAQQIKDAQKKVSVLKKQVQAEVDKNTQSEYKGKVDFVHVSKSKNPSQEYIVIRVIGNATTSIPVTGWTLKSASSGHSVTIPKGTYLFFAGMPNVEDPIYLNPKDTLYLTTGISPNGASFKLNKCSGYLGQFQKFIPYLSKSCPLPKKEDLSSIPKLLVNDACFDFIDRMPQCKIQTGKIPLNLSYECMDFIYNKVNYPSCISVHKNDPDFYKNEWRVYLKRSERLWKDKRESIVLYDLKGKIVDTLTY